MCAKVTKFDALKNNDAIEPAAARSRSLAGDVQRSGAAPTGTGAGKGRAVETFAWSSFFVSVVAAGLALAGKAGTFVTIAWSVFGVFALLSIAGFIAYAWSVGEDA